MVAGVPLNFTEVALARLAPVIVTVIPIAPLAGVKLVIRGATVKFVRLVAVPPGVVTVIVPVVALAGTVAVSWVTESRVKVAVVPLNLTDVVPPKPEPVIVTGIPTAPAPGEKPAMLGLTVNVPTLVAVPAGVVTAIFPVVAVVGTVAVILIAELTVKVVAGTPLKVTEVEPARFVPLIVTMLPTAPLVGVKLVIEGVPPTLTEQFAV
jgi:hypothetical protein